MSPIVRYVRAMGQPMMIIREYLNEMEALVARTVLEANNIPAVVLRDDAGGMLPAMHLLYPVRLAVRVPDAAEALRFMLLAMAPMMAYALPFAASFAATLVYHRMAVDHEAVAAHSGGLSHRSLLMPAVFTAFILMIIVATLSDQVIPRFLRGMQQMITVDVSKMFARQIARGNAVQQKGMLIYADDARSFGPDKEAGALDRLAFRNFAAL